MTLFDSGNLHVIKHLSKDTYKMALPRSTAFPRQNEEEMGANNDKTNATYETTDNPSKKNCIRGSALERPVKILLGVRACASFTRAKPHTLNSNIVPNTNICSVRHRCSLSDQRHMIVKHIHTGKHTQNNAQSLSENRKKILPVILLRVCADHFHIHHIYTSDTFIC